MAETRLWILEHEESPQGLPLGRVLDRVVPLVVSTALYVSGAEEAVGCVDLSGFQKVVVAP